MIAEPILDALLHLFALAASRLGGAERDSARHQVLAYLNSHIGLVDAGTYIGLYDELMGVHEGADEAAVLANAEQIASQLKALLHGFEKYAALIRLLQLAAIAPGLAVPRQIATLLSRELGLTADAAERMWQFITDPLASTQQDPECRILGGEPAAVFRGRLAVLRLPAGPLFLVSPLGAEFVRLEGHPLTGGDCHPLRPGQILRDSQGNELYFQNVVAAFAGAVAPAAQITFHAANVDYRFPGGICGVRAFSCSEHGGRMVGIMGGSGAGKSTLLNVLNGTLCPSSGEVLLNGRNLHSESATCDGLIGFIPQDDLLFEDLTVFENLDFAARLCLAQLSDDERTRRVRALLAELGQAQAAALKVGSPLQKTISGGQRKRLNIALELIREPAVLFVDEPTSGLSSADAENVMSLLKAQAARGKLVFVVIHQPASRIYRMFDALWILDRGGWPIFTGTPLEAVAYFRSRGALPGVGEEICPTCGGINPEQIFDIIEAKTIDQDGEFTRTRQVPPERWHELYRQYAGEREPQRHAPADAGASPESSPAPAPGLQRPGLFGQLQIFFSRDFRARLANRQYVSIALLEPPLLALLVGLVTRGTLGGSYSFHDNKNIQVFFFMNVIVALFLGLSVSAEEICRDGKILRRERFLRLSWWSYINSKLLYLTLVAAVQMLLYVAVANLLVAVPDLFLKSWATLFLCALGASVLGLNISAAFRSPVTIYILIPLILIPQMLLCGAVVKYDSLIATNSLGREVPRYTNLLFARWGYEALVVEQYGHNPYMRHFVELDARIRQAEYELDDYYPELQSRTQSLLLLRHGPRASELAGRLGLVRHEIARLEKRTGTVSGLLPAELQPETFNNTVAAKIEGYILDCRRQTFEQRRTAAAERRQLEFRLEESLGRDGLETLKRTSTNTAIQRLVLNLDALEPVGATAEGLYQNTLPIYQRPASVRGDAHFLAREKRLGAHVVPTFLFNLGAIVLLTLMLYLALYLKALSRLLGTAADR